MGKISGSCRRRNARDSEIDSKQQRRTLDVARTIVLAGPNKTTPEYGFAERVRPSLTASFYAAVFGPIARRQPLTLNQTNKTISIDIPDRNGIRPDRRVRDTPN